MNRRIPILAIALSLSVAAPAVTAETVVVQMTTENFQPVFVPATVTIQPGDTVQWINVDPFQLDHATVSGTGSADPAMGEIWNSGTLRTNESFEFTFHEAGTFEYFSVPHEFEGMFGVVIVSTTTDVPGVEDSTWGKIKQQFADILPRD